MFSQGHARRAVLLLMVLAIAVLWTTGQGIRAAAIERAESSATPADGAAGAPQETATATQKTQQTTVTDVAGRKHVIMKKVTPAERQAAADRLKAKAAAAGLTAPQLAPMAAFPAAPGAMAPPDVPGSPYLVGPNGQLIPDYSGLTANWAYSPTPTVTMVGTPTPAGNPPVQKTYPTDSAPNVFGIVSATLPAGMLRSFQIFGDPGAAGLTFHAFVLRPTGTDAYLVVKDSGLLTVPSLATGAVVEFPVPGGVAVNAGDVLAWYGQGIPLDIGTGPDVIYYPSPVAPTEGSSITVNDGTNFPLFPQARSYSVGAIVEVNPVATFTGGIRKFVDTLPLIDTPNNLGQMIPKAIADKTTYACATMFPTGPVPSTCRDADYYVIELGEYSKQMHSDLQPTRLRGYRQLATDEITPLTDFHYLGPLIVASKGRPVRLKFINRLPTGAGGNLFLPVDASVIGSGPGPNVDDATRLANEPNTYCAAGPGQPVPANCYTQNRATIHLHGGVTPWISDGTTHQWITPAGETLGYPKGVSVYNVPDMPDPGPNPPQGSQTFYYTNDQSARLMFYHDHAMGITRLNVYAGEAAGYLLTDEAEAALLAGPLKGVGYGIPLIIQDKTFVDAANIRVQDPTWNWGTGDPSTYVDLNGVPMQLRAPKDGDLWWPHVYQPAQNPYDLSGMNATGRWNYGPWFYPPTLGIAYGPVNNPYCVPAGGPCTDPMQAPMVPGTPNPSWGAEAFLDTPVINGTAYPTLTVPAGSVRFRILNAAHDRFWNLQLYKADTTVPPGCPTCASDTEVKMVPAAPDTGLPANWPQDGRAGGAPDPAAVGPDFIQIGTEGGFLPKPVVVPNQPVIWNRDPLTFNAGNVSDHALLLGPAERADVIVDFSKFAGQTLILYNDAPAAFPALDPRNDYYTGNPDQFDTGGTGSTLPGFGPNTRTLMQIKVLPAASGDSVVSLIDLETAWAPGTAAGTFPWSPAGLFESQQDPIIVGQAAYNGVYSNNTAFRSDPPYGIGTIFTSNVSFETVTDAAPGTPNYVTLAAEEKAIHDEMGATFDEYGRMKAALGLSMPIKIPGAANFIMQGYADPSTEVVKLSSIATMIGDPLADGTQIWRITHNGVDTHPIHFHLFHVQVLNRVGWDGAYRLPDATELGWKDTVRISPLEDTYVALRPIAPLPSTLPFKVPNSFRPLEPAQPIGSVIGFTNIDPNGNPIVPGITNQTYNFGWEYVWHCHILSHEENDMMRAVVFTAPPEPPSGLISTSRNSSGVELQWLDNSMSATSFTVERSENSTFPAGSTTAFTVAVTQCGLQTGCVRTYKDASAVPATGYYYRVSASNTVGSSVPNYPTITTNSEFTVSDLVAGIAGDAVNAPSDLAATIASATRITLTWIDRSANENNFQVWRSAGGAAFTQIATITRNASQRAGTGGTVTFNNDGVVQGTTYSYYVVAVKTATPAGVSAPTPTVTIPFTLPAAPTDLVAQGILFNNKQGIVGLSWSDNASNETSYLIQRCSGTCGPAGAWANVNPAQPADTTDFSEVQKKGTTWSYRVRATNPIGNSAFSNIATVIVP
jgi:FtsP/CotA-like multicopper oxidase with cupredoxin domain